MKNNFNDDSIFNLLMNLLKTTEIRKDASNSYYITSRTNDVSVNFLTGFPVDDINCFSVWLIDNHLLKNGVKLSLSYENKQKLLNILGERIKSKQTKKIKDNDFDNITSMLKEKYLNSDESKCESIENAFVSELRYVFQSIPGEKSYIDGLWLSRLHVFIQQKYTETINSIAVKSNTRNK